VTVTLTPTLGRTVEMIGPLFARKMAALLPADQRDTDPGRDRRAWIEQRLVIRPKDTSLGIIPLRLNHVQRQTWATWEARRFHGVRQSILKFRQGGISTLVLADFFEEAVHVPNTNVAIVSRNWPEVQRKLRIVKLFLRGLGDGAPAIKYNTTSFLEFENGSTFYIGPAGDREFGRGDTIHKVLLSEAAYYPDMEAMLTGITQAVPADGDIIIETTANGMGSYHQQHYADIEGGGRPGWTTLFLPWYAHEEYRVALDAGEVLTLTPEEQRAKVRYALSDEQIKWRRAKKGELKDMFAQEHPETAAEAFLLSGRARFDRVALLNIAVREPETVEDVGGGLLRIFTHPLPEHAYTIGADTAEGTENGDFDSAHVVDDVTGVEVATLYGKWQPHVFGDLLYELGERYSWAMLGVERNNHGHAVLQRLLLGGKQIPDPRDPRRLVARLGYPERRLYHHFSEAMPKLGWPTDVMTKPVMETGIAELIAEHPECFVDPDTVLELLSIAYHDDGKVGAPKGGHDDRFMSRGIAEQVRRFGGIVEQSGDIVEVLDDVEISPV
jgi:hypothetical protein